MPKIGSDLSQVHFFLRLGLALVFLYAGIGGILRPELWLSFIPELFDPFISTELLLKITSVFDILVASLLLANVYVKYVSIAVIGYMVSIIILDFSAIIYTFRDIGLVFMAISLIVIEKRK